MLGGLSPRGSSFGQSLGEAADAAAARALLGLGGSGAAFPASPAANDLFYRTDRQIWFIYDGTRWLSADPHFFNFGSITTAAVNTNLYAAIPHRGVYGIWLDSWTPLVVRNAGGAGDEWDVLLQRRTAGGVITAIDTFDGSAHVTGTWHTETRSLGIVLDASAALLMASFNEISGTANATGSATLQYRLIG